MLFWIFVSKIAASLIGVHQTAIYNDLSMAKMTELLAKSPFFVFNDPSNTEVLKTLVTKVGYILNNKLGATVL